MNKIKKFFLSKIGFFNAILVTIEEDLKQSLNLIDKAIESIDETIDCTDKQIKLLQDKKNELISSRGKHIDMKYRISKAIQIEE